MKIRINNPTQTLYNIIEEIFEELIYLEDIDTPSSDILFERFLKSFSIDGEYTSGVLNTLEDFGILESGDFLSFTLLWCHMTGKGSREAPDFIKLRKRFDLLLDILKGNIKLTSCESSESSSDCTINEIWRNVL